MKGLKTYQKWISFAVYPFFLCLCFLSVNGQSLHPQLESILKMELDEQTLDTSDPLSYYYQHLSEVLQIVMTQDQELYESLKDRMEERFDLLNDSDINEPWKNFIKAEAQFQSAFLHIRYEKNWSAFWALRRAFKIARENNEDHPNFAPAKKSSGVLNILLGAVPQKNKWLTSLFGMRGNIIDGLHLMATKQNHSGFNMEQKMVKVMSEVYLLEDFSSASETLETIDLDYPLIKYVKGLMYMKLHSALKARSEFEELIQVTPHAYYFLAETYFQELDYDHAKSNYLKFIELTPGTDYVKDSYLKMAISSFYLGDMISYNSYINQCGDYSTYSTEIDKNAEDLRSKINNQDSLGLKLRFTIDGGFYEKAYDIIQEFEKRDLSDYQNVELTYRKARIAHLRGDSNSAIAFYKSVISNADLIEETYYGPNSYLQLGLLFAHLSQKESAQMYLNGVLEFKDHPYKTSLDSKARLALERFNLEDE